MKLDMSFIFIKLYQEHKVLSEFVFAIRWKLLKSKYWHGPKKISNFSHSHPPLVQSTQLNVAVSELDFEICSLLSFKMIDVGPEMTKTIKLSLCKKRIIPFVISFYFPLVWFLKSFFSMLNMSVQSNEYPSLVFSSIWIFFLSFPFLSGHLARGVLTSDALRHGIAFLFYLFAEISSC